MLIGDFSSIAFFCVGMILFSSFLSIVWFLIDHNLLTRGKFEDKDYRKKRSIFYGILVGINAVFSVVVFILLILFFKEFGTYLLY